MNIIRAKWRNVLTAFRALGILAREETSFQIQMIFGLITIALSYVLRISTAEWYIVIILIGLVLAIEAVNTAIEELCDHVTPEEHERIGKVKDLSASASALIGITALIVGGLIFIPRVVALL
jgi:diacylglycerol kinase (ATP)